MSKLPPGFSPPLERDMLFRAVVACRNCQHSGPCEHDAELNAVVKAYVFAMDAQLRKLAEAALPYDLGEHAIPAVSGLEHAARDYARSLRPEKSGPEAELQKAAVKAHDESVAAERAASSARYSAYIAKNALADYRAANGKKTKTSRLSPGNRVRVAGPHVKSHVIGRTGVVILTGTNDEYGPYTSVLLDGDSLESRFRIEECLLRISDSKGMPGREHVEAPVADAEHVDPCIDLSVKPGDCFERCMPPRSSIKVDAVVGDVVWYIARNNSVVESMDLSQFMNWIADGHLCRTNGW